MSDKIKRKYVKSKSADTLVKSLIKKKLSFSVREASQCTEILLDNTHFVFASQTHFPKNKIYLFNNVKQQVKKWSALWFHSMCLTCVPPTQSGKRLTSTWWCTSSPMISYVPAYERYPAAADALSSAVASLKVRVPMDSRSDFMSVATMRPSSVQVMRPRAFPPNG